MTKLIVALCIIVGALALGFICFVAYSTWQRMRWRPQALRRIDLMRKRAKGPPRGDGKVTVVVTDIEGYSGESFARFGGR